MRLLLACFVLAAAILGTANDSLAQAPIITSQPTPALLPIGVKGFPLTVMFQSGDNVVGCRWMKDGALLQNPTTSLIPVGPPFYQAQIIIPEFRFADSGSYQVVVTNRYGVAISRPASLSVPNAPLQAWGANAYGQLGLGDTSSRNLPEQVTNNVVAVAAGYSHSLFVKNDGTLWAMGNNYDGQLGLGLFRGSQNSPVQVTNNVVAVAAGLYHSLFVKNDGTLWGMGNDTYGQFGRGPGGLYNSPVQVTTNVVAVAAGSEFTLFLKNDGTLWGMGRNTSGELGQDLPYNQYPHPVPVLVTTNVVAVAAGYSHSLFVKNDGTLWAMGNNTDGQLGLGFDGFTGVPPTQVTSNVVAVAAGQRYSLFVKNDGTLWGMGRNNYGQLGLGNTTRQNSPVQVTNNVVAVAVGGYDYDGYRGYSLFVKNDGTLWAMGENSSGELGLGDTTHRNVPVQVPGLTVASLGGRLAVAAIAPQLVALANQSIYAGQSATFTVNANGTTPVTYQWQFNGTNMSGATNSSYNIALATLANAGTYAVTVRNPGGSASTSATLTVAAAVVPQLAALADQSIYAGQSATFTVNVTNGTTPFTYQWQFNGANVSAATNSSYNISSATLANAGTYAVTVRNPGGFASTSATLTVAAAVVPQLAALANQSIYPGQSATFTVNVTNGTTPFTYQWQFNGTNMIGATNSSYNIASATLANAGTYAVTVSNPGGSASTSAILTVALLPTITTQPTGGVYTIGQPASLSVGASGSGTLTYQWLKDGTLLASQTNSTLSFSSFQFTNGGSYRVVVSNPGGLAISVPASLSLSNAPLQAWGYNAHGQLGLGDTTNRTSPVQVAKNMVAVAAGASHSLLLKNDGTLWAMGSNNYGQLGLGNTNQQNSPVQVTNNVVAVAAGDSHSLFVKNDGTLWAMGYNIYGQLGLGTIDWKQPTPAQVTNNVVAVAAGQNHSLFVKNDGTLWAMGANGYGQLGLGNTNQMQISPVQVWTNVVAVAAGSSHSLFVNNDGGLRAMGANGYGQLGVSNTNQANWPEEVHGAWPKVVAVAAGYQHSLFLKNDGTLWAMGSSGTTGQLGLGNYAQQNFPVRVTSNVVAVTAGLYHSLFVKNDGTLWAMGWNGLGQLGLGNSIWSTNVPVQVPGLTVASLGGMDQANHSLAVALQPADRTLPAGYWPGVKFVVTVQVWPQPGSLINALEEYLPQYPDTKFTNSITPDKVVGAISHGGTLDVVNYKIKFGPFFDDLPRTFTYELTPPMGTTNTSVWAGNFSVDGVNSIVAGMTNLNLYPLHPADNGPPIDKVITINEMTAYAAAWKLGALWPVEPNPIPIDYMTRAGFLWRSGEFYDYAGPNPPQAVGKATNWVPVGNFSLVAQSSQQAAAGPAQMGGAARVAASVQPASVTGTAVASASGNYSPGQALTVTLVVTPQAGVQVYAVEDQFPAGWTAGNLGPVENNGVLDAVNNKVKWGPYFDGTPRTFTYDLVPPQGASGVFTLAGVASFDGSGVAVTGVRQLSSGGLPPAITTQPQSQVVSATSSVTFSVLATGAAPLSYQWFKNGNLLAGASGDPYSFTVTSRANAGSYVVVVTNVVGSVTSAPALLRVRVPQNVRPPQRLGNGQFRLLFNDQDGGLPGALDLSFFEVQVSTNLSAPTWTVVTNGFTLTNGMIQFDDTQATNHPQRFYRVIEK